MSGKPETYQSQIERLAGENEELKYLLENTICKACQGSDYPWERDDETQSRPIGVDGCLKIIERIAFEKGQMQARIEFLERQLSNPYLSLDRPEDILATEPEPLKPPAIGSKWRNNFGYVFTVQNVGLHVRCAGDNQVVHEVGIQDWYASLQPVEEEPQ